MEGADKNLVSGYGLTLVAGFPLPGHIGAAVGRAQAEIEVLAPGRFVWYGLDHLHVTLRAFLRTRYRAAPPLRLSELPADLERFVADLCDVAAASRPWGLTIHSPCITPDGHVQAAVTGRPHAAWWTAFEKYSELDRESERSDFHLSLGFARPVSPASAAERVSDLTLPPIGECVCESLWLVHYANRTLNRIVGRVELRLGVKHSMMVDAFIESVGLEAE